MPLRALPVNGLHLLLQRAENLDTLELEVQGLSSSRATKILRGVHLPTLRILKTGLPHYAVAGFVANHPDLTSLTYAACCGTCCGAGICPLLQVHSLRQLTEISGPTSCVAGLVAHNPVEVLRVQSHKVNSVVPFLTSVTGLVPALAALHLDFFHADERILSSIRAAAPGLYSLRLTEVKPASASQVVRGLGLLFPSIFANFPPVQNPVHAPWRLLRVWAAELSSFERLQLFELCTSHHLIANGPSRHLERLLLGDWLQSGHGAIDRVRLWYSSTSPNSRLSSWSRLGREWHRASTRLGPTSF